ncbi:MAG TPA: 16S rRNA (cytosine(1402)-N(4))-methyltransferase RsmH [Campylobacterales bacterium]|nr:16S rRNA (cytosine(1402)-N(4))-methyltransferase RsmH [Campylobacterales bacterium]
MNSFLHTPVLLEEVKEVFSNLKDGYFIDCTLGYGGHSEAILKINPKIKLIGIDQDEEAIAYSKERLKDFEDRVKIVKGRFSKAIEQFLNLEVKAILADIGVSSLQLDKKSRGFSFDSEVLDMRMDKSQTLSAYDVVNFYPKKRLEFIFKEYGELRNYEKIAKIIIDQRRKKEIKSAKELSELLLKHLSKKKRIHPATLVFQAIRIEVNDELKELKTLLDKLEECRLKGAKVAIITFHSLEDKIVKSRFKKWAKSCICPDNIYRCECGNSNELGKILTKKPLVAKESEIKKNPRSRSAKMRVFQFKEE